MYFLLKMMSQQQYKKGIDCEPIYIKKTPGTQNKCDGGEATYFQDKVVPKVGFHYTSLAVILIDSVFKNNEPQYNQCGVTPHFLKTKK